MAGHSLYLVILEAHNGGHGTWPAVVITTHNPIRAVETARKVETLGYEIDWKDGVRIDRVAVGHAAQAAVRNPILYMRRSPVGSAEATEEYFWDDDLAKACHMTISVDWKASIPLASQST